MSDNRVYTLWGGQLSVYTAKVRSYLIQKGISFRECLPFSSGLCCPYFASSWVFLLSLFLKHLREISYRTQRISFPISSREHPEPNIVPDDKVMTVLANLICAFGSEGMNQSSMHYRWSFSGRSRGFHSN